MFQVNPSRSSSRTILGTFELIYHSTVREIRKDHRNALVGLLLNMLQAMIFVASFYLMFLFLGIRGAALRGDFLLYIMSGIFPFLVHTKAMAAVVGSEGPASPMMQHAPLNTLITIAAAALGSLYIQVLSLFVLLFFYHAIVTPVVIDNPAGAMGMILASWFSGVGVGVIFLSLKPWFPGFVRIGSSIYSRVNMIASGKMFVASQLPAHMLVLFDWNPLFHTIDQCRDDIFRDYTTHVSSASYPVYVGCALIVIGMMGQFYTRRAASLSWNAAR
ncbi:MAG: ABC transporter permease [Rhodobacterales bacterium]|nr:ABC transporter permease [Rhodobacterales bacterium]